jgi:hypothetical protein
MLKANLFANKKTKQISAERIEILLTKAILKAKYFNFQTLKKKIDRR